ncbi:unnamed protein product [Adineta steineri]|uniref:Transmembrane protein n=1 Tax=Adineta steineri TaxID=433720 RepID=A0A816ARW0_9BILA|nr:unnamed protein product [Adineta steineri]CAF1303003.1 unnamed protein product [Adineta steineri]CAF1304041.1 unnamed protein product [Adineta steineri]CAF1362370.1 unnamed protein product [Adineta steineri]CAF1600558.1 unnamed protein product [Adineta steineri]
MNLQSNEQPTFTNNDTSIYFNNKQSNNLLSSNIESRFSPTANHALDSHSINELIDLHKKRLRERMMYFYIVSGIFFLIGLVLLIIGLVLPKCSTYSYNCSSADLLYLLFGGSLMGNGIIFVLVGHYVNYYGTKQQFEDINFSVNTQQPVLWRLDGEQWVRYLNYIHGPNRIWIEIDPLSCFCCRRSTYERLMNRQYGQIILHENGLIIDKLYFVSFRQHTLESVQILYIDQHPQIIGLRIHTYLQNGRTGSTCYFDLFAPPSVSLEQIQALARAYISKISGVSALDLPLEVIHLPESILSTHS